MAPHDDDLTPWETDPVFRALTAPGTAGELAGEDEAVAAFNARPRRRSHRRIAGRFGTGTTTIVVAVVLSGGVAAAAYNSALPSPIQNALHSVTSRWDGLPQVPASHEHNKSVTASGHGQSAGGLASPTPTTTATPAVPAVGGGSAEPSTRGGGGGSSSRRTHPSAHGHVPAVPGGGSPRPSPAVSPIPSPTPSPTLSPTTSPTPSPSAAPPAPATLAIGVDRPRELAGNGDRIFGRLTDASSEPVVGYRIRVLERMAGGSSAWQRVGVRRTDADGAIGLRIPPLPQTARFRLVAVRSVHSAVVTIVVVPRLGVALAPNGPNYDVNVTTQGAEPGDTLVLLRRHAGRWARVGVATVDDSGHGLFSITTPARTTARYRVVVRATRLHGRGATAFRAAPSSTG
jgi:hypothetical protein